MCDCACVARGCCHNAQIYEKRVVLLRELFKFVDMERTGYIDLAVLQARVKEGLSDLFPERLWVRAEISQWSPRANGHCYLSLSQTKDGITVAEARAMIWRSSYLTLKDFFERETGTELRAGITVLVRVQVSFHEVYGYSLVIDDIDPAFTLGERAAERQRTIERLTAGGYMELQRELALPLLPYRLAVISSGTAAGLQDFRNHLLDNEYGFAFEVVLFEALMQGEGAPASIIDAIDRVQEGQFDAVLLLRGGGSELDLACFDDYSLAVALATCPVPVFTAIGHDKDVHVADLVAHKAVKTPTALADEFLACYIAEDERIGMLGMRIVKSLLRKVGAMEAPFVAAMHRIRMAASARLGLEVSRVALQEARIASTDPRTILDRGYVLVTGEDGKLLKSASRIDVGHNIGVRFGDGRLKATVTEVTTGLIK